MTTRPPERPCTSCGQMCRSKNRVCMACSTGHTSRYVDGEPVALTNGSWQPVRGVLRWVPDPEVPDRDELEELRMRMRPDPAAPIPVACPKCGALVTETCRTKNGHRTGHDHGARKLPRVCACGAALDPKRRMCETCARIATLEQNARWRERVKAKKEAA